MSNSTAALLTLVVVSPAFIILMVMIGRGVRACWRSFRRSDCA